MRDLSFNTDISSEAASRRDREVDALVRSRRLEREARTRLPIRSHTSSRRARLIAIASPMVGILAIAITAGLIG